MITANGGKPPKRYQNGGTFRVHCCLVCNLDDKRSLLRGMTGDDHTSTLLLLLFSSFPFSISIWISFVLSCLFLVGYMLSVVALSNSEGQTAGGTRERQQRRALANTPEGAGRGGVTKKADKL